MVTPSSARMAVVRLAIPFTMCWARAEMGESFSWSSADVPALSGYRVVRFL
jgi:hypothetical protein